MILAYWNALRVNDDVVVHDDDHVGFALSSGTVTAVESRRGSNGVTVRITNADGTGRKVHPKRLATHLHTGDSRLECWRCERRTGPRNPSLGRP
ncbi:hypothetical protein [Ilumatobacter nonamiensis]|uniref:hypothetical protein n=1 Tax=Ilumatobacter nonamiensis TaxID=467093 RepID=UPI0003498852|nr:hypothetical protein [Ilumatobacter nonamiensis]